MTTNPPVPPAAGWSPLAEPGVPCIGCIVIHAGAVARYVPDPPPIRPATWFLIGELTAYCTPCRNEFGAGSALPRRDTPMPTTPDPTPTDNSPHRAWQQIPTKNTRMKDVKPPQPGKDR